MTASSESSDVRRADEYASTPVDESAASTAAASRNVDALTFDEMLALHVGENGRAQIRHFLISSAAWLPAAFLTLMTVFTARMPAWRCTTLDGCTDESSGELKDICELEATEWEWVSKTASIVSEWNLVCDEEWKTSAADSIFFVGFFFGAGIIGQLADVHGRRVALYGSLLIAGGASVITGVSFGYWEYFLFKVVLGFGCGGIGVASFVLCTEPLGAPWRGFLGVATQYWWSSGICLLSGIAWIISDWRELTIFIVLSVVLYCVLTARTLKESPRWLLASGKPEEALENLTALAKGNDREIPVDGLPPLKEALLTEPVTIKSILPYKALRFRLYAMAFIFMVNSMVYYGLSLNVGSLAGSIYVNSFLSGLVEFPSHAFAQWSVEKFGRKITLIFLLAVAGIACLLSGFNTGTTQTAFALLGRWGITASFNMIFVYTTELFPTVVRSAALGTCSQVARLGGIAAPQIILLKLVHPSLPSIIFGGFAVAGCAAATVLQETKGLILEETLEGAARQAEVSSMDRAFFRLQADEEEETLPRV